MTAEAVSAAAQPGPGQIPCRVAPDAASAAGRVPASVAAVAWLAGVLVTGTRAHGISRQAPFRGRPRAVGGWMVAVIVAGGLAAAPAPARTDGTGPGQALAVSRPDTAPRLARIAAARTAGMITGQLAAAPLPPGYTVTVLPGLYAGGPSAAYGLSGSDVVVGDAKRSAGDNSFDPAAWRLVKGVPSAVPLYPILPAAPPFFTDGAGTAWSVNTAGQIAGTVVAKGRDRAVRWDSPDALPVDVIGSYQSSSDPCAPPGTQPPDGGCSAFGINSKGDVAGTIDAGLEPFVAFADGTVQALRRAGGGVARSINDSGLIAGTQAAPNAAATSLVTWPSPADPPTILAGSDIAAPVVAVNARGLVAGSDLNGSGKVQAWNSRAGALAGPAPSRAESVNAAGDIVGRITAADGRDHAALWRSDQHYDLIDLNSAVAGLLPPGWWLADATAINEQGDIAGIADDTSAQAHAVLLRTVPVVFVPGIGASSLSSAPASSSVAAVNQWLGTRCILPDRIQLSLYPQDHPGTPPLFAHDVLRHEKYCGAESLKKRGSLPPRARSWIS